MSATNWTPQTTNPTAYTPQAVNATQWQVTTPTSPTSFLLAQDSSFILLQTGGEIGLEQA